MVTKRHDDRRRRQGEYRAICLGKVGRQSFAILQICAIKYCRNETQAGSAVAASEWRVLECIQVFVSECFNIVRMCDRKMIACVRCDISQVVNCNQLSGQCLLQKK